MRYADNYLIKSANIGKITILIPRLVNPLQPVSNLPDAAIPETTPDALRRAGNSANQQTRHESRKYECNP
jgi:hypothetical protein